GVPAPARVPATLVIEGKERAVKLGDLTALRPFRRRGAYSAGRLPEGASFGPAPRKETSAGATNAGETLHLISSPRLALRQRHRHEARRTAALHAHENAVLVVGAGGVDRLSYLAGAGDALAGDLKNDVAFLEAALGRRALRIDLGDHDAFPAGAGHAVGRGDRQAELRHAGSLGQAALVFLVGVGLVRLDR